MFSKNEKSVRVTTLPQPRTVLYRYGERFQFSDDFWLMLVTFFLLYLTDELLKAVGNTEIQATPSVCLLPKELNVCLTVLLNSYIPCFFP